MHLGAWPGGSWLPWRAAPLLLCSCSCLVFKRLPQEWSYLSFHLLTCTMGFAPIKWTCTAFFRPRQLTDRAILANRQTQEKKSTDCEFTAFFPEWAESHWHFEKKKGKSSQNCNFASSLTLEGRIAEEGCSGHDFGGHCAAL